MNDPRHRTDTLNPQKKFIGGEQKQHWVEFQLLDEQGQPLANVPYQALNDAIREGCSLECSGQSDAQGVIRIDGLHPIPLTLKLQANPLAELLKTRRLRAKRAEPPRPAMGVHAPLHGPQRSGFSPIEKKARTAGHDYHYLVIGQLCDKAPDLLPPLTDRKRPPAFHFPDETFKGFTVGGEQLDRRHVLEVCPFRAWSLLLHHQSEYSLANAYNLGLMSILAYSTLAKSEPGSVKEFFEQQCLDLSRTPRILDNGQAWPCLVTDVPFSDRYIKVEVLDTARADPPEGHTQLFYAISASQVLVAWRGTEMEGGADLRTDATFRPVKQEVEAGCGSKVACADLMPVGKVHLGFRDAFEMARRIFTNDLVKIIPDAIEGRGLFICGHSLGGALGLVHAASLKSRTPLLYTYGMPRTFTLQAVKYLGGLWHFRHVNDKDIVPRVPPEAALDNYLYDIYGPMGVLLGLSWSTRQIAFSRLFKNEDPYSHHGEIVMFFKAEQHRKQETTPYSAYRKPDGTPYRSTIAVQLPEVAKLYLVPSLSEAGDQEAERATQCLNTSLSTESRAKFFPRYGNPAVGRMLRIGDHFMSAYQPYIHNQLLESINPLRDPLLDRQVQRRKFEQQLEEFYASIPEDEATRNQVFLNLQCLVQRALNVTQQAEGGGEALQRFDAIADPKAYYEKTYG